MEPFEYLGFIIENKEIWPQKITIRTQFLGTLTNYQKLTGDINWIRPFLYITADDLKTCI